MSQTPIESEQWNKRFLGSLYWVCIICTMTKEPNGSLKSFQAPHCNLSEELTSHQDFSVITNQSLLHRILLLLTELPRCQHLFCKHPAPYTPPAVRETAAVYSSKLVWEDGINFRHWSQGDLICGFPNFPASRQNDQSTSCCLVYMQVLYLCRMFCFL